VYPVSTMSASAASVLVAVPRMLETLMPLPTETLLRTRYEKFRRMGNLSIS